MIVDTLGCSKHWLAENVRSKNPCSDKLVTLLVLKNILVQSRKNEKQNSFSDNTQQRHFDSGGENHMWVASYALELTPLESAFNEAYGSRCINSMASITLSGICSTPLSEAPKSLAASLTRLREGMSLGLLKEETRSSHTEEGSSSSSCWRTRLIASKLNESDDPLIATNLAASLSIHAMPTLLN